MKTKLNPGHFTLETRILAALVLRYGGDIKLTEEELAYIDGLDIDADRLNGVVKVSAHRNAEHQI